MDFAKLMLLLVVVLGLNGFIICERPAFVNIGAILTYDSVIGMVAKAAIEAAVADVNADKNVLGGTQLKLITENTNSSGFIGAIGALKVLEKDAVAIVGPQVSTTAHMVSFISNGLQIPLVSFAATDPTLSSLQYPFFIRMTQSDSYQMSAMADLIDYYGWRQVIGIYVDNEYGRNGIDSLADELATKMSTIYKIALPLGTARDCVMDVLHKSKVIGPRVYVVHATPELGLEILSVAQQLHMMTDEYAWLATDWLCTAQETSKVTNRSLNHLQGIVGFCQYIPGSSQKNHFMYKWEELLRLGVVTSKLNAYGFYAYDTVWAVAHAINDFFKDSGRITFTYNANLHSMKGKIQFNRLKSFDGGHLLREKLLLLNFTGLTGQIQFDSDQNLKRGTYQIINFDGEVIHTVGYWDCHLGLTISLPNSSNGSGQRNLSTDQILESVTWPGGKTKPPRGWVVATSEKPLRIAVPHRVSFLEFVSVLEDNLTVKGYCIDVFEAAIKLVPYNVPHEFVPFGDGHSNPNYWKLVNKVADEAFDAAAGDITISMNRTRIVDFTQPYLSSGLVIAVALRSSKSSAWRFLWPFSLRMWCVIGSSFVLIGAVIWLLEHRVNSDFRGSPKRQCLTIFLFSFLTLFHSHRENIVSALGRFVAMVWFFLLLVITSSYTASLTSFLTIQQMYSPINGIDNVIASKDPIGYQEGSFAKGYMINVLKIHPSRLVPLRSPEAYAEALRLGPRNAGVAAIVDELPYVELFIQRTSGFGIVGLPFTKRGWGFAFPRGSHLPIDLSSAILKLAENGELQKIHNKWFCEGSCGTVAAKRSEPYQLNLSSFRGLFMVCGIVTTASLLIFLLSAIRQFIRYKSRRRDRAELSDKGCSQVIYSFFDFLDEKEEAIRNIFRQHNNTSQPEVS